MDGWSKLGKPDFATCGKLFYRLPADLRENLNRSQEKVLIWTIFFAWTSAHHSGRGGTIASFSQTWLGESFGRSRWTVSRALVRLEELGLLKRIRRPPDKNGTFRTNLLALGARLSALLALHTPQTREKSPCSKTAPQQFKELNKSETTPSFGSVVSRLLQKTVEKEERCELINGRFVFS